MKWTRCLALALYAIVLLVEPIVHATFPVLRSIEEVTSTVETSRKVQLVILISSKTVQNSTESSESLTGDDESVETLIASSFPHLEKILSGFDNTVECVIADIDDSKAIAKKWNVATLPAVLVYKDIPIVNPYTRKLYRPSEVLNAAILAQPSAFKKALKQIIPSTYVTEWTAFTSLADVNTWIQTQHNEEKTVVVLVSKQKTISHLYRALSVEVEGQGLAFAYLRQQDPVSNDVMKTWEVNEIPALIAIPKDGSERVVLANPEEMKTYAHLQAFIEPFRVIQVEKENGPTKKKTKKTSEDVWFVKADNFDKQVLSSNLIWIISFMDPETEKGPDVTKQMEKEMNELQKKTGIIAVAGVRCSQPENEEVCARYGYDSSKPATVVRVFPITLTNDRRPEVTRANVVPDLFDTVEKAKDMALTMIPESQVHIMGMVTELNIFINRALSRKKMPIVLVTSKMETPAMFKALSVSLAAQKVAFGVVPAQDPQIRLQFNLPDTTTTALLCLIQVDKSERPPNSAPFGVLSYDKKTMGPYTYHNIARFVMSVLSQYPPPVDETGVDDDEEEIERTPTKSDGVSMVVPYLRKDNMASLCAGSAICVIGFFEDHVETLSLPPVNDQPSRLNKTLEILSHVASDSQKNRQPFQFMWTNGKCQSAFAQAFGVGLYQMPTVVVYSPSKQRYATNIGLFDMDNTSGFLKSILSGKINTIPIDHVPDLVEECSYREIQNDHADVVIEEDEEELGDLLNEILENEEQQRRKLEAELKASKTSSSPSTSKKPKKSKKSRKKKKKKTRDEL